MIFGINAHVPTPKEVALASRWQAIRIDFEWWRMNPAQGQYDFATMDRVIGSIPYGKIIIANVWGTPAWASRDRKIQSVPSYTTYYFDFMARCLGRYGTRIFHWSVWNEPNLKQFWHGTIKEYLYVLLSPVSDMIRRNGGQVLSADLATSGNGSWYGWLDSLADYKHLFDVTSIHCYADDAKGVVRRFETGKGFAPFRLFVRDWRAINPLLRRIGKPVWITETGWSTDKVSEETQRDNVRQIERGAMDRIAETLVWYELRDDPGKDENGKPVPPWGFYKSDLSPKKVVS